MTDVAKRLLLFIEHEKLNASRFEAMLKFGNGFVRHTNARMNLASQEKIANAFPHLNMVWLMTGEGKMLNGMSEEAQEEIAKENLHLHTNAQSSMIVQRLLSTIDRLIEVNSANAEANKIHAEANKKNTELLEKLVKIMSAVENGYQLPVK